MSTALVAASTSRSVPGDSEAKLTTSWVERVEVVELVEEVSPPLLGFRLRSPVLMLFNVQAALIKETLPELLEWSAVDDK